MSALTIDHVVLPVRVPPRPVRPAVVIPFPARSARGRTASPSRVRITRRGRLTLTVMAVLAVCVAAVAVLAPAATPASQATTGATGTTGTAVTEVVVTPGVTLWEIAAAVAGPGQDVRDVIAEIREMNDLESSGVVAGQELVVPAA